MTATDSSSQQTPEFERLRVDMMEVCVRWGMWKKLYGSGADLKLLDAIAPSFFSTLFAILVNDVILSISRLTDPTATSGRQNLVLRTLIDQADPSKKPALESSIAVVLASCNNIRTHRNKRVGHRDFNVAMSPGTQVLPGVTVAEVDLALKAAERFLNLFEAGVETRYTDTIPPIGDVASLLAAARDAVRFRTLPMEQQVLMHAKRLPWADKNPD